MAAGKKKTFRVILRGVAPWVSEISYEKDAQDLRLFFTLSDGTLSPNDVVVQGDEPEPIVSGAEAFLKKTEGLGGSRLSILTLSEEDLDTIGGSKLLPAFARTLADQLPASAGLLVLLPASPQTYQALLWQGTPGVRERIKRVFPCQEKGRWLLAQLPGESSAAARQRLLPLLTS